MTTEEHKFKGTNLSDGGVLEPRNGSKGIPVDIGLLRHVAEEVDHEVSVAGGGLLGSGSSGRGLLSHDDGYFFSETGQWMKI